MITWITHSGIQFLKSLIDYINFTIVGSLQDCQWAVCISIKWYSYSYVYGILIVIYMFMVYIYVYIYMFMVFL